MLIFFLLSWDIVKKSPKCVNTVVCGTFSIAPFVQICAPCKILCIYWGQLRPMPLKSCASPFYHYVTMSSLRISSELELVLNTILRFYMLGNIPLLLSQQYFLSFLYSWSPAQADTFMNLADVFIQSSVCVAFRVLYTFMQSLEIKTMALSCVMAIASVTLYCLNHWNTSEALVKIWERLLTLAMYCHTFRNAFHISIYLSFLFVIIFVSQKCLYFILY